MIDVSRRMCRECIATMSLDCFDGDSLVCMWCLEHPDIERARETFRMLSWAGLTRYLPCSQCPRWLPPECFSFDIRQIGRNGRRAACRDCQNKAERLKHKGRRRKPQRCTECDSQDHNVRSCPRAQRGLF